MDSPTIPVGPPQSKRFRFSLNRKANAAAAAAVAAGKFQSETESSKTLSEASDPIALEGNLTPAKPEERESKLDLSGENLTRQSPCGLRNIGNTCYLAAVVQLLRHLPTISCKLRDFANLVCL